jgi:hypothetical protein
MTVWTWIAVGTGSFFVVSLLVSLAVASVLGRIGGRISDLYEIDAWTVAPTTRGMADAELQPQEAEVKAQEPARSAVS